MTTPEAVTSQYPTTIIDLPSKGFFYPKESPLSSGQIEVYFMTAKHEDILTSVNLAKKGLTYEKLLESLFVDKTIRYGDLLLGDRNALLVATRILAYGKEYPVVFSCEKCGDNSNVVIDLQSLNDRVIEYPPEEKRGTNEFEFLLPISKKIVKFRILSCGDERDINRELDMEAKHSDDGHTSELTTRMAKAIISVDGDTNRMQILKFVQNMPAKDARAFRKYAQDSQPDVDATFDFFCDNCSHVQKGVAVPIGPDFFYPSL